MAEFRAGSLSGRRSPLPPLAGGTINEGASRDEIVQVRVCALNSGQTLFLSYPSVVCTLSIVDKHCFYHTLL